MKDKLIRFFFGHEHPVNMYESCPAFAWLIMLAVIAYGVMGSLIIFKK